MNIRSIDVPVALHWNIAHGALFQHLVGSILGKKARKLVFCLGDVHVYSQHIDEVKRMLSEFDMKPFPKIEVLKGEITTITDFTWENIKLIEYNPLRVKYNLPMVP